MIKWIKDLFKPAADAYASRQARKQALESATAKLAQTKVDAAHKVTLTQQESDALRVQQSGGTWKDEYATVSVGSILNIIVIGGIAQAFGFPQILEGIVLAVNTLVAAGVNVGTLIELTVGAAVGLTVWKRL